MVANHSQLLHKSNGWWNSVAQPPNPNSKEKSFSQSKKVKNKSQKLRHQTPPIFALNKCDSAEKLRGKE
jgi:hypothetical protein